MGGSVSGFTAGDAGRSADAEARASEAEARAAAAEARAAAAEARAAAAEARTSAPGGGHWIRAPGAPWGLRTMKQQRDLERSTRGGKFYHLLDGRDEAGAAKMWEAAQKEPALMKDILEFRDGIGSTCLMAACSRWNVEMATALIEAGMNVNAATEEGERVLNWTLVGSPEAKAPWHPQERVIRLLVSKGAQLGPGYGCHPERLPTIAAGVANLWKGW